VPVPEIPVVLPQWGATMHDATIVEWLKGEGERVEREEPICVVETDKVDAEVTAPEAGVLTRHLAHEDDKVAVGAQIATIATGDEAAG
jgi:2-oxoglutarate dehydrogenase E2 component (dihydrolipoamide succinyltransferase)